MTEDTAAAANAAHGRESELLLARLPLFDALAPEQIALLAMATQERRLRKGAMLFQKGDPANGFFIVVAGQVKLAFLSAQGNEKVVEIIGPGQSFGEAVMFMDRPYPVYAEGLVDARLLHVGKETVFELLQRDASFSRRMIAGLSRRLHALLADVETYSLRSSSQRLIGYLLQLGENLDPDAGDGDVVVSLPISKHVLASRLNLTAETLSRALHELTAAGLIAVEGRRITIHGLTKLRQYDA